MSYALAIAALATFTGLTCLATSMQVHWRQITGTNGPNRKARITLRMLAAASLLFAATLCFWIDRPSIAALAWIMLLSANAFTVAMVFAWRPRWLRVFTIGFRHNE